MMSAYDRNGDTETRIPGQEPYTKHKSSRKKIKLPHQKAWEELKIEILNMLSVYKKCCADLASEIEVVNEVTETMQELETKHGIKE